MFKKKKKQLVWITLAVVVLVVGSWFIYGVYQKSNQASASQMDTFAQCLKDKGATFYGAFWCPHCQNQKALFGSSQKYLPYFECSTPDGQSQNDFCQSKKIPGYPTWEFKDGSRLSGEIPLAQLAEKTGCALPK